MLSLHGQGKLVGMHVLGHCHLVPVWTSGLGAGRGYCEVCSLFHVSLQSHTPFIPLHIHPVLLSALTAHILLVTSISLSLSYYGILGLSSNMEGGHPSPNLRSPGLVVRLVALKK